MLSFLTHSHGRKDLFKGNIEQKLLDHMKWIDGNLWLLEDQSVPAEKWDRRSVIGTVEIVQWQ